MRTILLILMLGASIALAGDTNYTAKEALEKFKQFTLSDGASYYKFAQDGTFESGPLGLSGRTLNGTWKTADGARFTIMAKAGWMNGISALDDYRRIVFHISHLSKPAPKPQPPGRFGVRAEEVFEGYYFIDELIKLEKPKA